MVVKSGLIYLCHWLLAEVLSIPGYPYQKKAFSKLPAIKAFTTSNYLLHLIFKMKGFSLKKIGEDKLRMTYKNDSIENTKNRTLVNLLYECF